VLVKYQKVLSLSHHSIALLVQKVKIKIPDPFSMNPHIKGGGICGI